MPKARKHGGQHVASGAFEDGAQAASESLEPTVVWPVRACAACRSAGESARVGNAWATTSANLASAAASTPLD
jgi:hypothetical protein